MIWSIHHIVILLSLNASKCILAVVLLTLVQPGKMSHICVPISLASIVGPYRVLTFPRYELDSLAAFLEVSTNYYNATQDLAFFSKYNWLSAVSAVMDVATAMMTPTYAANGSVNVSPYSFTRLSNRASETLENNGLGNPVQNGTGLIRSAFRPSDDAAIYQLFIPANMMFSRYLASAAEIVSQLDGQSALAAEMSAMSSSLRDAITAHGIVTVPKYGQVYAYEVDGYGSQNIMDE